MGSKAELSDVPKDRRERLRFDERSLGKNMAKAGRKKPGEGYTAHRILPIGDSRGGLTGGVRRKMLGLDLDGAVNGAWLPSHSNPKNLPGLAHNETYGSAYLNWLAQQLKHVKTLEDAELVLNAIRKELEEGKKSW